MNLLAPTETLNIALQTLRRSQLRTGLSMLGVMIGIASVIGINSVGRGVQKATEQQLQNLGTDVLVVMRGSAKTPFAKKELGAASTLTWQDAEAIKEYAPAVQNVTAFIRQAVQIVYQDKDTAATGIGTDPHFSTIKNFHPVEGRFFTENELSTAARVVVLGSKVRDDLFSPNERAVNASMRIDGERFQVIGVMEPKGAIGTEDVDTQVFIPLSTMASRIIGNNALAGISISGAWVQSRSQTELEAAQFQVTNLLRLRHNIYPPQEDDFWIANQLDLLNTLSTVVNLFTVMIAAIGAISLLVGGIGIANIMLISVVERTHEIGIRKAIGASETNIFVQFLAEAMLISLGGGAMGIVVGLQIAFGAAIALKLPFVVSYSSVAFAFLLCFMVGLISGVLPARRAAKLDPVAALAGG